MDTKKLSFFIIAVGVILVALGGGHWTMAENEAEHRGDFRKEMRSAEINRLLNGNGEDVQEALRQTTEMLKEAKDEVEMHIHGYKLKVDHTISYSLMIGGMLVIILGVGMRISSSKKPDTEKVA